MKHRSYVLFYNINRILKQVITIPFLPTTDFGNLSVINTFEIKILLNFEVPYNKFNLDIGAYSEKQILLGLSPYT